VSAAFGGARIRDHARRLIAALLLALGFWWLSLTSVASWLTLDAAARSASWTTPPNSPWHWRLAEPGAIVWPGSSGLTPPDAGAAKFEAVLEDGVADLSLALRGERIDPTLVIAGVLQLRASSPLRVLLIGQAGGNDFLLGTADLPGTARGGLVPVQTDTRVPLDAVRLRLEATAGTRIEPGELLLLVRDGTRPVACREALDPVALFEGCPSRVPSVRTPGFHRPETMLLWRDAVLRARPAAVVAPAASLPTWIEPIGALRSHASGWMFWLLACLPLLAAAASHVRPARAPVARAAFELAGVFGPWLLLAWAGWPMRDSEPAAIVALAASLLGAALLRDPRPDWSWLGTRSAWRASGLFLMAAAAVVGAAACANALDGDGFHWMPFGSDHAWRYPFWALLQQWLLLRAITPRMRLFVASDASACLAAGALFGLLHLPNLSLMLLTFGAGTAWAWLGLRHRALLPLVASHAILGLSLFAVVPPWLVRSAEIGGRFMMEP
jgi:hypothetical protein